MALAASVSRYTSGMSEAAPQPSSDRRTADVAIVCTHEAEVRPLIEALDRSRRYSDNGMVFRGGFLKEVIRVAIVEAGSGYAQHRKAAETLISEHRPAWVICTGFCASLVPQAQAGELCIADALIDQHGQKMEVQSPVKASAKVHVGRMFVADTLPETETNKRNLAETHDAICCDTTSLAVAQVCESLSHEEQTHHFLTVKAIVESLDENLPSDVHHAYYDPASQQPANLLGRLKSKLQKQRLEEPWQQRLEESSRNLNRFLVSVIQRLAEKLGKSVY